MTYWFRKHADHDQKSHGNWAHGGRDYFAEFAALGGENKRERADRLWHGLTSFVTADGKTRYDVQGRPKDGFTGNRLEWAVNEIARRTNGLSVPEFVAAMGGDVMRGVPGVAKLRVYLNVQPHTLNVTVTAVNHGGDTLVNVTRYLDFNPTDSYGEGAIIGHSSFAVNPRLQGQGIGKDILRTQMDFYQKLGVQKVILGTDGIGGYVWPKYGFVPDKYETNLGRQMLQRLHAIEPPLSTEESLALQTLIGQIDRPSVGYPVLWTIGDMNRSVTRRGWDFRENRYGAQITLGQFLLEGTAYNAELYLSNKEQMARFNAYVGKPKKYR